MGVGPLIGLLTPLGVPGALFIFALIVFLYIRNGQIAYNRSRLNFHEEETTLLRKNLAEERGLRETAEKDAHRWRNMAMHWQLAAHKITMDWGQDREDLLDLIPHASRPQALRAIPQVRDKKLEEGLGQ